MSLLYNERPERCVRDAFCAGVEFKQLNTFNYYSRAFPKSIDFPVHAGKIPGLGLAGRLKRPGPQRRKHRRIGAHLLGFQPLGLNR